MVENSSNETNFSLKLLLTNTQALSICKTFANGSSANVNISKTQLPKMIQLGGLMSFPFDPHKTVDVEISSVNEEVTKPYKCSYRRKR